MQVASESEMRLLMMLSRFVENARCFIGGSLPEIVELFSGITAYSVLARQSGKGCKYASLLNEYNDNLGTPNRCFRNSKVSKSALFHGVSPRLGSP